MSNPQTALITGASSGIGLELARVCAEKGHNLVLVARSLDRLNIIAADLSRTYNIETHVVCQDLSKTKAVTKLIQQLEEHKLTVDILINNAGFGGKETFAEADIDHDLAMIAVNVTSLTELTARLLPGMVERGNGRILNVASMVAFLPGPYMAVYHATKAYVLSFSQAIAAELDGTGVTVSALCPGATRTSWGQSSGLGVNSKFDTHAMSAAEVAQAGYKGMEEGKPVVFASQAHHLGATALGFVPLSLRGKLTDWRKKVKEEDKTEE